MAGRLLFDATGLLQWYAYFWQPSGIQRVTEGLLASLPFRRHPRLEIVARILGSEHFHQVDAQVLTLLVDRDHRRQAIARIRAIFAQSMGLATVRGLRAEAKSFHFPYIALGRTGLSPLIAAWYGQRLPALMQPLRSMVPPDSGDVLFNPGDFWCHEGYVDTVIEIKRRTGVRLVQMIHDLYAVDHPEWHHPRFGRLVVAGVHKLAAPVDCWLTNSQFVRGELAAFLASRALPERSITAVPMGWDSFGRPDGVEQGQVRPVIERHGLAQKPFILHVGTIEPRKNLLSLLDALAELRHELGNGVPDCVLVGRDGWQSEALRRRLRESGNENGTVHWFREVTDRDLPAFYRAAQFTVVPSSGEGWGLPVQESLAHGVPCIASDAGALREAGRDLALYFDPRNPAGLKAALAHWIADPGALAAARARVGRALETERLPTWDDAAETVLASIG